MKIKHLRTFIISILIPLSIGFLSSQLTRNSIVLYSSLNKPALSPPAYLFPIIWTVLYVLMGISSYLVYTSGSAGTQKALSVYAIQLLFNFGWSIIFFNLSAYLFAFIWLIVLIGLIVIMIYLFYRINPIAGLLQIPYLVWCVIAAYLNLGIYLLN